MAINYIHQSNQLKSLKRPKKISWVFPYLSNNENWISKIPSKSIRKLANKYTQLFEVNNLKIDIKILDEKLYKEWYVFYTKNMLELKHDIIASPEWFINKKNTAKEIFLIELKDTKIGKTIGASIILRTKEDVWSHAFKATDRIDINKEENISIGSLMEFIHLDFVFSKQNTSINSGLSRNGFGYFNSLGYLIFKLRMGYIPTIKEKHGFDQDFFSISKETPTAWFVTDDKNQLYLLLSHDAKFFSSELLTYVQRANIRIINPTVE